VFQSACDRNKMQKRKIACVFKNRL